MSLIVVCGALANKPGNGGAAWTRLSWILGLKRFNCDVFFVDQIAADRCVDGAGASCDLDRSTNLTYFRQVTDQFGLRGRSALIAANGHHSAGLSWSDLLDVAGDADLLINISGHLTIDPLKARFRKRVFLDLDPGYTQFWYAAGLAADQVRDHHFYFTVGENIGRPGCEIPLAGIPWRPIRQPVVLDEWPVVNAAAPTTYTAAVTADTVASGASMPLKDVRNANEARRFTTVASWRGPYGRITHHGVQF
jgi:hypothetical protein